MCSPAGIPQTPKLPLCLVAIRTDPDSEGEPDLYTIDIDSERPLVSRGSIIMFTSPALADTALARDDDPLARQSGPAPTEYGPHDVLDLPSIMHRVSTEHYDPDMKILEGLNFLFDMLNALGGKWIDHIKPLLFPFADHLTFNKEYGDYLDAEPAIRRDVTDAILWTVGVVVTHATIVRR